MNFESVWAMFEAYGRNKYASAGVIQWMINSAWPSLGSSTIITCGRVVENPSKNLAFFLRLKINRCANGEEILPVLWQDNYFSLLTGGKTRGHRDLSRAWPYAG